MHVPVMLLKGSYEYQHEPQYPLFQQDLGKSGNYDLHANQFGTT